MAFEHRPGSFMLFKNKKTADNQPDYKGDGMALDGTLIEVSAWIKDGMNGKFMSCKMNFKGSRQEPKPAPDDVGMDIDNDVPFANPYAGRMWQVV